MKRLNYFTLGFLLLCTICCQQQNNAQDDSKGKDNNLEIQGKNLSSRLQSLLNYEVDSLAFPRSMENEGTTRKVPSSDWTSGFYVGSLLQSYRITGNNEYLQHAQKWLPYLEKEKWNGRTHDMGFKIYCSFGNAYEITQKADYKKVLIESAKTLTSRFNPEVGCIKSWDFGAERWDFPVIIDNMMNLELLFEATHLSGDSSYYFIAESHAEKTMENHFRADNSSVHVVDYNPNTGEVIKKITHQGFSDNSSWARGQAWGLYGFTMAYRYTKNEQFLQHAQNIADFIFNHENLPEDYIPYWDFNAPSIPDAPRDASAAAVIASALVELSYFTAIDDYKTKAQKIVKKLSSDDYSRSKNATGPFLLNHSTGNMPKADEVNVPISYADYYYLESINRLNKWK